MRNLLAGPARGSGCVLIGQRNARRKLRLGTLEELQDELNKVLSPSFLVGWRLAVTLVVIALCVIVIAVLFLNPSIYRSIWMAISDEPFTFTMQRVPWLYVLPTGVLVTILGTLPFHYTARAIVIFAVYLLGFLGGHVLWCGCRILGS